METPQHNMPPREEFEGSELDVIVTELSDEEPTEAAYVTCTTEEIREPWQEEATPEAKVDTFLESISEMLYGVEVTWGEIGTMQKLYVERLQALKNDANLSRDIRRVYSTGRLGDPRTALGVARIEAQKETKRHIEDFTHYSHSFPAIKRKITQERENVRDKTTANDDGPIEKINDLIVDIAAHRTLALVSQESAVLQMKKLLQDDEAAPIFIARLRDNAQQGQKGFVEYPGLLELVATHISDKGSNNLIQKTMERLHGTPEMYAVDFLERHLGDSSSHRRKELNAAFGVMKLLGSIIEGEFGASQADLMQAFAQRTAAWPAELTQELQTFAAAKAEGAWQELKQLLSPYERKGRLATAATRVVHTQGKSRNNNKKGPVLPLARRGDNHETVTAEVDKEPIDNFGVLVRALGRKDRYSYQTVESLDALFAVSNLQDYVEKHAADRTLEPMLKAALAHLTTEPFDPLRTRRLRQGQYSLVEDERETPRHARRYRPQHLSDLEVGPIASKTRIIYDVVTEGGKQRLIIHGAFIKQDIENITTLPRR